MGFHVNSFIESLSVLKKARVNKMADQLTILKLMAMLDVDTSITFLQTLADDRYDEHDDYARIVMYCNDLLGMYRPSNNDNAPWIAVRDKIASMDEQDGYNDMDLVIDAMIRDMNDNQLALLRTLAYGPASYDYVRGAIDLYRHLDWKD
jgi:hypothetical protein